jgi:sarcosine oxidase/L-pipecolate oxidase
MTFDASSDKPSSVLIIGSGVFGLATAHAICKNPHFKDTTVTVVDRQPFPTLDGSSVSVFPVFGPRLMSNCLF